MKIFDFKNGIQIVARSENTRYGFRHLASAFFDGMERSTAKCCYYNRTWERYQYQTVLRKVIEKVEFSDKDEVLKMIEGGELI
jgi:hypothetical protein